MGRIRRQGALITAIGMGHLLAYAQVGRLHRPPPLAEEMLTYQLWAYICLAVVWLGLASWSAGVAVDVGNWAAILWKPRPNRRALTSAVPRLPPPAPTSGGDSQAASSPVADNIVQFPTPTPDLERWSHVTGADFDIAYKQFDGDILIEYSGPAETLRALQCLPNPLYTAKS